MKTHHLPVYILCAGEASRFGKESHVIKQLLYCAHGESFLERIVRQVRDRGGIPIVVTHHPEILRWYPEALVPRVRDCTVQSLSSCSLSQDHNIVLLGDVCYSRDLMDRIFRYDGPLAFWGNKWEIYALRVRSDNVAHLRVNGIAAVISGPEGDPGYGKLRRLWQACNGLEFGDAFRKSMIEYVGTEDYSMDIDTPEDFTDFQSKSYRVDDRPQTGRTQ